MTSGIAALAAATPRTEPTTKKAVAPVDASANPPAPRSDTSAATPMAGRPVRRASAVTAGEASIPAPAEAATIPFTHPGASNRVIAIVSSTEVSSGRSTPDGTARAMSRRCVRRTTRASSLGGRRGSRSVPASATWPEATAGAGGAAAASGDQRRAVDRADAGPE